MRNYKDRITLTMSVCTVSEMGHATFADPTDVMECWADVSQMSSTKTMLTFQQANIVGLDIYFRNPHCDYNGIRWHGHDVSIGYINNLESNGRVIHVNGYYQVDNPVF